MADLQQPYFDPSQYPAYLDAQRKQQIAQMLMGSLQSANQTPANWDSMKVVPKRGMLQNVSVLADALLAKKGLDASNQATSQYMQGLYGGGQQPAAPPISPDQQASAIDQAQASAPGIALPTGTPPPSGLVQQQPTQNPLIPPGMSRQQATMIANAPGGMEALTKLAVGNYTPLETDRQLRAAGIDPNGPQGLSIKQAILAKQTTNNELVKPNETVFDATARNPIFTAPGEGVNTTWGPDGKPVQAPIPGAAPAAQDMAAARAAGTESQKPIRLGTDANGRELYGFPTPPAATGTTAPKTANAPLSATAPGTPASPAVKTSQEAGAKAGQDYSTELRKNSEGALEIRRSVSELRNLATQATPNSFNDGKLKVGSWMIAAGADPKWVSQRLGVDVGALQAAEHNQGGLAVGAIHGMTSRGTNFDLETFMRQNPNLDMNSPEAFKRVADYMDAKAQQTIDRQKDFATGLKTGAWGSPDQWETNHTSHWNDLQNQSISQGKFNTPNPNAAPKAFATEAAAQAAAAAGQLKPGDRIKIGNQTGTWH